jgi:hypothetical protein
VCVCCQWLPSLFLSLSASSRVDLSVPVGFLFFFFVFTYASSYKVFIVNPHFFLCPSRPPPSPPLHILLLLLCTVVVVVEGGSRGRRSLGTAEKAFSFCLCLSISLSLFLFVCEGVTLVADQLLGIYLIEATLLLLISVVHTFLPST